MIATARLIDERATALTRARYQRLSPVYDLMEGMAEFRYGPWREKLWALVEGQRILEIGVGTGNNTPFGVLMGKGKLLKSPASL